MHASSITEMTTLKATLLSIFTIAVICMCGVGIYSADASSNHASKDGYGVIAD
jgi:hypothetical membrane protein